MKILRNAIFVICALVALFVLHVPLLSLLTKPHGEYATYPSVTTPLETENFEMAMVMDEQVYQVWYDTEDGEFILFGITQERRVFQTLDAMGQTVQLVDTKFGDPNPFEDKPRYIQIPKTPERKYVPTYNFADLSGTVEMMHYQFETYTWPYIFYFIPVVTFDWAGTAYINILHRDELFKFSIPTDYFGNGGYFNGNIDGQIYAYLPNQAAPNIMFISIEESSHIGTHREGYGFYVLRPK